MSYLDVPRLHFFGQFLANPGTINNILANFNPDVPTRPLWNPNGVARFFLQGKNVNGTQLSGVTVRSVMDGSGNLITSSSQDPLVGAVVTSNSGTPAKIVDLDPWQQFVSQLFGLQFSLTIGGVSGAGFSMEEGAWAAVPSLTDLWFARVSGIFQTVITPDQIVWNTGGNAAPSPLLQQFQEACADGISVKMTTDFYDTTGTSPTFNIGRLSGVFGPAKKGEPVRFPTRKMVPQIADGGNPQNASFWSAPFTVDVSRSKAVLDLGNSFQVQINPKTGVEETLPAGTVEAVIQTANGPLPLSPALDVSQEQYQLTSGVVEADLTPEQLATIQENPVGLTASEAGTDPVLLEAAPYVILAQTFLRLSPGEKADLDVHAYRFGQPLANETISVELITPGFFATNFPQFPGLDQQIQPGSSEPASGLDFGSGSMTTDADGLACLTIRANAPQPLPDSRKEIDSQVYFVGGLWQGAAYYWWPMNFAPLSVLVYDEFTIPENPTWTTDVHPVMDQYMRLYPGMKAILDMADYHVVQQNAKALQAVFSASLLDPARMPVSRDLAPARIEMVLKWIAAGLPK